MTNNKNGCMKKFVVERNLPGAGNLTAEELQSIAQTSNDTISQLGKPYHWVQSYITDDKIYCIHIAESEEVIREQARRGKIPINTIREVTALMDPTTSGKSKIAS
jgi:hypothetical protein